MELTSTEAVIDALGGSAAVAELTNRKVNAASNWRNHKRFPANTYLSIKGALAAKGKSAPDSLWGMTISEKETA